MKKTIFLMVILSFFIFLMVPAFSGELEDAIKLYEEQNYEGAKKAFEKILTDDPENSVAHNYMGLLYLYEFNFPMGQLEFQKAIISDPSYFEATANLADLYYVQDHMDLALETYDKALELDPENSRALSGKGSVLFNTEDYEGAEEYFRDRKSVV